MSFKIGVLGYFNPQYPRNESILACLENQDVALYPIKSQNLGRSVIAVTKGFWQLRASNIIFVPTFNQLIAPYIWFLGILFHKKILLDYMVGLSEVYVDRGAPNWKLAIFRMIDRFNLTRLTAITDTNEHKQVFQDILGMAALPKLFILPISISPYQKFPMPNPHDACVVQFMGTYIPFHGIDVIIRAAKILEQYPKIHFNLMGKGQIYQECLSLAKSLDLTNITFDTAFIPYSERHFKLAESSIILGVFGSNEKTQYVIPNKVLDGLAIGRPMITAYSKAISEFFVSGEHLIMIQPDNPQALAEAILDLVDHPEKQVALADSGYEQVHKLFATPNITETLLSIISTLLA